MEFATKIQPARQRCVKTTFHYNTVVKKQRRRLGKGPTAEAHSRFGTLCRETVDQIMQSRGWEVTDASKNWGIAYQTLRNVVDGDVAPSAGTLNSIIEAEGWDPVIFFLHHRGLSARHLQLEPTGPSQLYERFQRGATDEQTANEIISHLERLYKLRLLEHFPPIVEQILILLESTKTR